ncbi:MAG TPA: Crp/Fnr family transcriptional regulator [Roseomonas sp.]
MANPLIMKFGYPVDLTEDDHAELERITTHARPVGPRTDLAREGDRPEVVRLVMRGLACRYQRLSDGSRQIVSLMLPGDMCGLHIVILGELDHSIATLSACEIVEIPRTTIKRLTETNPRITRALCWSSMVDQGILRNWLASKGRRQADRQLLHLLCELLVRFEAVGLAEGNSFPLPITQEEMADILGVSTVHANRTLQWLRAEGLATFYGGRITILDRKRAWELASFDPNYLHLKRRS